MNMESSPLIQQQRNTKSKRFGCIVILFCVTFERLAYYSLLGTLIIYLQTQVYSNTDNKQTDWDWYSAVNFAFVFQAVLYVTSVLTGWLTDAYLGKFKSTVIFMIIYIIGYYLWFQLAFLHDNLKVGWGFTCSNIAHNSSNTDPDKTNYVEKYVMPTSLIIIAVGVGGVKSSIAPFGADQVRTMGANGMRTFFSYFYWCINLGSLLALGGVAYLQQDCSYPLGYLIAFGFLITGLALLVLARLCNSFIRKPPGGSPLTTVCKILCEACSLRRSQSSRPSNGYRPLGVESTSSSQISCCVDYAKVQNGGSFHESTVNDTKVLGKILLIFTILLPYWLVYSQMETTFVEQGLHMRLETHCHGNKSNNVTGQHSSDHHERKEFQLPIAWLTLFDVVFLIILIPIFDRLIYPLLDRRGKSPSLVFRISVGQGFGFLALVCAGFVETIRIKCFNSNHICYQTVSDKLFLAADMSIFWQIPQYSFIALSELFTGIASLELAYTGAPKYLHGTIMGFFWFSQGIGSFLGTASIALFHLAFKSATRLNCFNCSPHLSCYYFTLAGLQLFGLLVFIPICKRMGIGWTSPTAIIRRPLRPNPPASGYRFYNAADDRPRTSVIGRSSNVQVQNSLRQNSTASDPTSSDDERYESYDR